MKNFEKVLDVLFWSLAIFVAIAVIGVSAGINFKYGAMISPWIAGVFVAFGLSEVLLPAIRLRCQSSFHKRLAWGTAVLLVVISFITSISFLQSSRQNAEDQQKGVVSTMHAKQGDAALAQQSLSMAIDDLKLANAECARQRAINAKDSSRGYVTRECNRADRQKKIVEKARADLEGFRLSADSATSNVTPANERIYHDLASIFGGSSKTWQTSIGLLLAAMIAALGWVFFETLSHVWGVEKAKKDRKARILAEIEEKKALIEEKQLDAKIKALEKEAEYLPDDNPKESKKKTVAKPDVVKSNVIELKPKQKKTPSNLDIARKLIQEGKIQPTHRGLTQVGKRFGLNVGNDAVPGIRAQLIAEGVIVKVGSRYKLANRHLSRKGD